MTVLRTVLDNSVAFSLLFAGVWLVKTSLRKHLSARLHYVIWAAVLVSLLIPVRIESISLWNLLPRQTTESIIQQAKNLPPLNGIVDGSEAGSDEGNQPASQLGAANNASAGPPAVSGHPQPARTDPSKTAVRIDWPAFLWALWLAGMAVAILWMFVGSLRLRRHIIRCGFPETPAWLEACAQECGKALNMRRNVRIVLQPVLPMPAVMGIFHPILAMPESIVKEGNGQRVRHILMHELSHVKRGDLIVIALLNLLNAVYWFNPLVWLCFSLIRADMETSCDNDAVDALGKSQRQEYIRTLVHFSGMGGRSRMQAALSLHDAGIKMKKRIGGMFMTKKTKPAIAVPVITVVLALLLAASATGCLPVAGSTDLGGPSASLKPDSPTTAPANTTEPAATNSPSVEPQTPEPTPSPSAAPEAAQWEGKYKAVLNQYREFARSFSQNGGGGSFRDWGEPWEQIAPDVIYSTRKFGYAFRDMDGNGIPELFLLTSDGSIWAMYTFVDGAPKLLGTFWSRNSCALDQSDVIYTNWSNGALDNGQDAYRISKDGRELELIERVAMESTDENGNPLNEPRYYKCVGSEDNKEIISQAEADAETSKFPKNNDNSGLEFVPLN